MERIKNYLAQLPLHLSAEEIDTITNSFSLETFRAGDHFVREGQRCFKMAFVLQGCFRFYVNKEDQQRTFYLFQERSFFSENRSLLTGKPSKFNVEALEESELATVPYTRLRELYKTTPGIADAGYVMLENLLVSAENRLFSFISDSPEERYRILLDKAPALLQRVPQKHLASYLGVTPISLSRIKWRIHDRAKGADKSLS